MQTTKGHCLWGCVVDFSLLNRHLPLIIASAAQCLMTKMVKARGLPGGASGKELTCQYRRHKRCGSDPWVGKIPWRRTGQCTPAFSPGDDKDRGAWQATVQRVTKIRTWLKWQHKHSGWCLWWWCSNDAMVLLKKYFCFSHANCWCQILCKCGGDSTSLLPNTLRLGCVYKGFPRKGTDMRDSTPPPLQQRIVVTSQMRTVSL